jgi:hypothetical protein
VHRRRALKHVGSNSWPPGAVSPRFRVSPTNTYLRRGFLDGRAAAALFCRAARPLRRFLRAAERPVELRAAPAKPDLPRPVRFVFVNRFLLARRAGHRATPRPISPRRWSARGHSVSVVASHPGGKEPSSELHRGVAIFRVRGTRLDRFGLFGKLSDYVTFYVGSLCVVIAKVRSRNIVVPLTDPPLLGIGVWIAARLRGAKLVHWVQDIYPEIAISLTSQRWLQVLAPLRNLAWRRADACVVLGTDMARVLEKAGVKTARLAARPQLGSSRFDRAIIGFGRRPARPLGFERKIRSPLFRQSWPSA